MKKICLLLFLLARLFDQKTFAQQTPDTATPNPTEQAVARPARNPFFVYLSLSPRLPLGYEGSLNVVFGKGYSLSVFLNRHDRNSYNTPYYSRTEKIQKSSGLTFGKIIRTGKPKVRFHLKGGVGFGTIERRDFTVTQKDILFPVLNTIFGWGHSYSTDITVTKYSTVSLLLQPSVEFPFTCLFGLGLGLFADVNKRWPVVGVSANLHLGYLRERIKK